MYELIASLLVSTSIAIWVFFDAQKRNNDRAVWFMGALFLPVFVLPNYFAKRNLKNGETRRGGTGWQVLKNFALYWILFMVCITLFSRISEFRLIGPATENALGLMAISMLWIIPTLGALLLGLLLKKPSQIERGPTGELAENNMQKG